MLRKASDILGETLRGVANCCCDSRLQLPDVAGYLADMQIRVPQIGDLALHIRENWPNVTSVEVGIGQLVFETGKPNFTIRIAPYSKTEAHRHWPVKDDIRRIFMLVEGQDGGFFFLPKSEPGNYSRDLVIYRKDWQIGKLFMLNNGVFS